MHPSLWGNCTYSANSTTSSGNSASSLDYVCPVQQQSMLPCRFMMNSSCTMNSWGACNVQGLSLNSTDVHFSNETNGWASSIQENTSSCTGSLVNPSISDFNVDTWENVLAEALKNNSFDLENF